MNTRGIILAMLCLAGAVAAPARAQLIHLSMDVPDAGLIFRANHASTPWDRGFGFVTELDLYYDKYAKIGALNPAKNFWHVRMESTALGNYDLVRPLHSVTASDNGLMFSYFVSKPGVYENFELNLVFDSTIPTEGALPLPPLPELGSTEYFSSRFFLQGGHTYFDKIYDLAEVYGGGSIQSVTTDIIPIPEPSSYAMAALLLVLGAISIRTIGFCHLIGPSR